MIFSVRHEALLCAGISILVASLLVLAAGLRPGAANWHQWVFACAMMIGAGWGSLFNLRMALTGRREHLFRFCYDTDFGPQRLMPARLGTVMMLVWWMTCIAYLFWLISLRLGF